MVTDLLDRRRSTRPSMKQVLERRLFNNDTPTTLSNEQQKCKCRFSTFCFDFFFLSNVVYTAILTSDSFDLEDDADDDDNTIE